MRSFNKDDSGANLLIEYMFTIIIAAILFGILLLSLQSIITRSDQIIMGEEQSIAANIVANQLSDYSNELYLNDLTLQLTNPADYSPLYSADATLASARSFDIPKPYTGKQYSIEVTDDDFTYCDGTTRHRGVVKVTYVSDPSIYSTATFNSRVPVQDNIITCNTYRLKISLNRAGGTYVILEEA